MRIEIVIILITAVLIGNVYTEGKLFKKLLSYKKYYQMAGIAFGGLVVWWLMKKNPQKANEMFATSHEYLKYLPKNQIITIYYKGEKKLSLPKNNLNIKLIELENIGKEYHSYIVHIINNYNNFFFDISYFFF